jgi:hypothetical protein
MSLLLHEACSHCGLALQPVASPDVLQPSCLMFSSIALRLGRIIYSLIMVLGFFSTGT